MGRLHPRQIKQNFCNHHPAVPGAAQHGGQSLRYAFAFGYPQLRVGLTGGGNLPPLPRRVGVVGGAAAVIHAEPAVLQIALHPAVDLVVGYRVFLRHSAVIFPVFQTVQHHDHPLHRRHGAGAALGAACALAAVAGVVQGRARTVLPHPMHQRLVIDVIF